MAFLKKLECSESLSSMQVLSLVRGILSGIRPAKHHQPVWKKQGVYAFDVHVHKHRTASRAGALPDSDHQVKQQILELFSPSSVRKHMLDVLGREGEQILDVLRSSVRLDLLGPTAGAPTQHHDEILELLSINSVRKHMSSISEPELPGPSSLPRSLQPVEEVHRPIRPADQVRIPGCQNGCQGLWNSTPYVAASRRQGSRIPARLLLFRTTTILACEVYPKGILLMADGLEMYNDPSAEELAQVGLKPLQEKEPEAPYGPAPRPRRETSVQEPVRADKPVRATLGGRSLRGVIRADSRAKTEVGQCVAGAGRRHSEEYVGRAIPFWVQQLRAVNKLLSREQVIRIKRRVNKHPTEMVDRVVKGCMSDEELVTTFCRLSGVERVVTVDQTAKTDAKKIVRMGKIWFASAGDCDDGLTCASLLEDSGIQEVEAAAAFVVELQLIHAFLVADEHQVFCKQYFQDAATRIITITGFGSGIHGETEKTLAEKSIETVFLEGKKLPLPDAMSKLWDIMQQAYTEDEATGGWVRFNFLDQEVALSGLCKEQLIHIT